MGGCCCCYASKQTELIHASPYYHYPRLPEEREPLSLLNHGPASTLSTGLLVDNTNLTDTNVGPTQTLLNNPEPVEESKELDVEDDLKKSTQLIDSLLVEECPTCLEEYDEENPKIITKCEHDFHLACILEWLERSDTCPVCDQDMIFDASTHG